MSSGARVSIPNSVRKMIQNIKEITGNHSEEEIYAMLKECSMDPNETAQKLLLQDTFHEVKRKRDRRKENLNNKESAESKWRPGMQGRGSRAGRGSYSHTSHDTGGGKGPAIGKENGTSQGLEKGVNLSSLPISQETKNKETTPTASPGIVMTNGPTGVGSGSIGVERAAHLTAGSVVNQSEEGSSVDISKFAGQLPLMPHVDAKANSTVDIGMRDKHEQQLMLSSSKDSASVTSESLSGEKFSGSEPVLVPSQDSWLPGAVSTIKCEVGSQCSPAEQISVITAESKSKTFEAGSSFMQGKMPSKSQGVGKNQLSESVIPASSTHGGSSVSRSSSNYHSRAQQAIGPQKVGASKEWKPKPTNPNLAQGSEIVASIEVSNIVEASTKSSQMGAQFPKDDTSKLQRKLDEIHISDAQHVIIPNHIHVPEAEKIGFCFGSFDVSFALNTVNENHHGSDKNPTPLSETSEAIEVTLKQTPSNQNALATAEEVDYPNHPQSPTHGPENLSPREGDVSSNAIPEYSESKEETPLPPGSNQHSVVHTSPNYSFGFVPPVISSQLSPSESSESQARDINRLPSFIVPQPLDPTSYYAQFYRSGADSDGRISPFHTPGVATKFGGNVAVLPPQASQSPQEGGNSVLLSTASPTPLVTQATGLMQSSIAVTQQPLPVFRQPTGVHIPHYPPNYIPYGHYFSPFYVPPPAMHHFLSNSAFHQQPQAGSVYPAPPAPTAKYSLSQYKPGTNAGNSTHIGVPGSFVSYNSSSSAGYSPSPAVSAGNSSANDDLASSQFKESSVYITGQQTEGSAVWIAPPGQEISGLQASSFYNIPQGQMTFAPAQAGHGTFAGIYHPSQAVTPATVHPLLQQTQTMAGAVDMVGPTGSVYQQPQHAQMNWPNNY